MQNPRFPTCHKWVLAGCWKTILFLPPMDQPDFDTFMANLRERFAETEQLRQRLMEKLLEMGTGDLALVDKIEFRAPAGEHIPDAGPAAEE